MQGFGRSREAYRIAQHFKAHRAGKGCDFDQPDLHAVAELIAAARVLTHQRMARFIEAKTPADQAYGYERVHKLLREGRLDWILSPTPAPPPDCANATAHGGFDDDRATLEATIARILGRRSGSETGFDIHRSEAGLDDRRRLLCRALDI